MRSAPSLPLIALILVLVGCDLAMYEAALVEGGRRSQELTEISTVQISGWDVETDGDDPAVPTAWYPATLGSDSGYLIHYEEGSSDLTVAWVDSGSVTSIRSIFLFGADTSDRWDAWVVPIDATLQAQYQTANPGFPPRAPALFVARFAEAGGGTQLEVDGVVQNQAGTALVVTDLRASIEGALQTTFVAAATPSLYSLQLAPYGPGATVGGSTTDTAGGVFQILARDNDSGQERFAVITGNGLEFAEWAEFLAVPGAAAAAGGSFSLPLRSDGEAATLIRHATLVDGGPGSIFSFRDDDYAGAPWRSFGVPPGGGSTNEFSTGFGISSVTVEGEIRTARSGNVGELSFDGLPDPAPSFGEWGSLWYAGAYPTAAGEPGNPAAFPSHARADVFTQVGLARSFGETIVEATSYRR